MQLRCENKLQGVLEEGIVELKCSSRFCGAKSGVVVIHRFSTESGKLIGTSRFRDTPPVGERSNEHGAR